MESAALVPGQMVDGKYRIERVLGRGAMGFVVAAWHVILERRVALKFMLGSDTLEAERRDRFFREARVAARLQSPHTARVLDVGMIDGAYPYIVMEFLEGTDLAAVLQERGPLSVDETVTYALQACSALAEAHAVGIFHRDIKPANLFVANAVGGGPCLKLVDFGIAKLANGGTNLTATEQQLGSPHYMSPEAINASRDVDGRTDIWALGVCLYEMLANAKPFHAETALALVRAIFFQQPRPLDQLRRDVPADLAAVIARCLEKHRERRWPTVEALAAALAPYASSPVTSWPMPSASRADDVPPQRRHLTGAGVPWQPSPTGLATEQSASGAAPIADAAPRAIPLAANSPPTFPRMPLHTYASLVAELDVFPGRVAEVLQRYGVPTESARNALDTHWHTRFTEYPETRVEWQRLVQEYREYLLQSQARRGSSPGGASLVGPRLVSPADASVGRERRRTQRRHITGSADASRVRGSLGGIGDSLVPPANALFIGGSLDGSREGPAHRAHASLVTGTSFLSGEEEA